MRVSLPDELLLRIISTYDRSNGKLRNMPDQIRALQPLSAINQRWRRLTLPLFCKRAFVSIDETEASPVVLRTDSNLGLLLDTEHDDLAREMVIWVTCSMVSLPKIQRLLTKAGFDRTAWLTVRRLEYCNALHDFPEDDEYYAPESVQEFSEFLSLALPSLRDIDYEDMYSQFTYNRFTASPLINEHIGGPTALHSLRTYSDLPPMLSHYQGQPISIQKLDISGINFPRALRLPKILASSLVELDLSSVDAGKLWDMFASNTGDLVFTQLRRLSLVFHWQVRIRMRIQDGGDETDGPVPVPQNYMQAANLGRPRFPVLQELEVRRFSGNLPHFLSLFPCGQLRRLVLGGLKSELPASWDFSPFRSLQQLSVRYVDPIDSGDESYIEESLRRLFHTSPLSLQKLTVSLMSHISTIPLPVYAPLDTLLTSLSISGDVRVEEVVRVLENLSSLQRLMISDTIVDPLVSNAQLVGKFKGTTEADFGGVSTSLRVLEDEAGMTQRMVAKYRQLLFCLLPRLPNVYLLLVGLDCVKAVRKSIDTTLGAKVVPAPIDDRFRKLKVQPWKL
ncbi:hypothetical protein DL89DRAFT_292345 [Linderina pennispora]|uniref:F-box domain-containing protein n=1 Tax=Linderina pennispora TaxID=61395 RepID=A0A1Y1WB06_9FUNG|nr:uncharacterized protein DL89DRAFT_292345 [Linderina pennispora]ORX70720.1 hypothetical protein DL89DRAFT_292345 [Linderina pennispora]